MKTPAANRWRQLFLYLTFAVIPAFASDPMRPQSPELVEFAAELSKDNARSAAFPSISLDTELAIEKQLLMAASAISLARYSEAAALLDAAEQAAAQKFPQFFLAVYERKATLALEQLQFPAAQTAINAMLARAVTPQSQVWKARALWLQGVYWRRKGDYAQALSAHLEGLALRQAIGDQYGEIESINSVATLRRRAGDFYQALAAHNKALALARTLNIQRDIAESLRLIARIHSELEDVEEAHRFYLLALEAEPNPGFERSLLLIDTAGAELRRGNIEAAEQLTTQGEQMAAAYSPNLVSNAFSRRSSIAIARNEPLIALAWIDKAMLAGAPYDGARSILNKRAARIKILIQLKRFPEAIPAAAAALKMAQEVGDLLIERDILQHQAKALFGSGDTSGAYLALSRFSDLNQQISSSMTTRRIGDLEASLKQQSLAADLAITEKQRDLSRLQVERQSLLTLVLAIAGVALIFAIFALRSRIHRIRAVNKLLQAQAEQLKQASETDLLTGLFNRRGAMQALDDLQKTKSAQLGVAIIDIDFFKRINDQYGHHGGDQVLCEIAQRLSFCSPKNWSLARWGGEEFLLFGPSENAKQLQEVAQTALEQIRAKPIFVDSQSLVVTASLGACLQVRNAQDGSPDQSFNGWEAQLQKADIALYQAKVSGRDRAVFV